MKAALGALFPGREPVVQHFRNARGNGGERSGLSGLSGLLLGGRSWRQRGVLLPLLTAFHTVKVKSSAPPPSSRSGPPEKEARHDYRKARDR